MKQVQLANHFIQNISESINVSENQHRTAIFQKTKVQIISKCTWKKNVLYLSTDMNIYYCLHDAIKAFDMSERE